MPVKYPEPKPMKSSDVTDTSHGLKRKESKTVGIDCGVQQQQQGSGIVQKKVTDGEKDGTLQQIGPDQFAKEASLKTHVQNCKDQAPSEFTSTSKKVESASMHAVSASLSPRVVRFGTSKCTLRRDSPIVFSGTSQNVDSVVTHTSSAIRSIATRMCNLPLVSSSANTYTRHGGSNSRVSQNTRAVGVFNQQKNISAKDGMVVPNTAVRQYRLRNLRGNKIKSVTPRAKPQPQWCPTGLTHTQKRRVQRLRASEIREKMARKKSDEWLNKDRPMVPVKITWKEKHLAAKENRNENDTIADKILENTRDAPTDMDVDKGV
jgi:hypothetical protein